MQGFDKYVNIIYYNRIVKRVQYLTAIRACTIVNEPSIIHCGRDALIFIPTFSITTSKTSNHAAAIQQPNTDTPHS